MAINPSGSAVSARHEEEEPTQGVQTCDAFCTSCRKTVPVRLPKRNIKRRAAASSTPKTKLQNTGPIENEDVVDMDLPPNMRPKHKPKPSAEPCEKVLTERQLINLHVKFASLVCRDVKQREAWSRVLGKRFPPQAMATARFKDVLALSLGQHRQIPPDLALRWWEVHRGKRKVPTQNTHIRAGQPPSPSFSSCLPTPHVAWDYFTRRSSPAARSRLYKTGICRD